MHRAIKILTHASGWRKAGLCGIVRLGFILAALLPSDLKGQPIDPGVQYRVKAAFLIKFAQFVEWPNRTFATADTPITIGILGDDPFGKILDDAVSGELVNGRKLLLVRLASLGAAKDCQMLFVGWSQNTKLTAVLTALKGAPVLTVGESADFCEGGGMIKFLVQDNRVKFEINPAAAGEANLKLSSKLLSLAKIVQPAKPKDFR